MAIICKKCSKTIENPRKFCSFCGAELEIAPPVVPVRKFCSGCGSAIREGVRNCPECDAPYMEAGNTGECDDAKENEKEAHEEETHASRAKIVYYEQDKSEKGALIDKLVREKNDLHIYCAECNHELSDGDVFCARCGTCVYNYENEIEVHCKKCGNVVKKDLPFCSKCGSSQSNTSSGNSRAVDRPSHGRHAYIIISCILSAVTVYLMFQKWLEPASIFRSFGSAVSIFRFFEILVELRGYVQAENDGVFIIIGCIVVLLVGSATAYVVYAISILACIGQQQLSRTSSGRVAFVLLLIAFLTLVVTVFIFNDYVKSETHGLISAVVKLAPVSYIAMIAAVINRVALTRNCTA